MKDLTPHDKAQHPANLPIPTHTPQWYKVFSDRCPTCGVEARHK